MADKFKNFQCSACTYYVNEYCFEHLMKVKRHDLCPEWKALWED